MMASAKCSISSNCGLNCSSTRSTPAASNWVSRSATCSGKPLLVICVARRGLLDIRDAPQLVLSFAFRFSNDGIAGDPELERRQIVTCAAFAEIHDFLADALRRIAVHKIGVALLGDQLFCRGRLAARVKRWPRLRSRLWLEHIIVHAVILPGIRKMVLLPNSIQNVEPL